MDNLFQVPAEPTTKPSSDPQPSVENKAVEAGTTEAPELTAPVSDPPVSSSPEPIQLAEPPPESAFMRKQREDRAERERRVAEFNQRILDARAPKPEPAKQPVAPPILEQTRLEMEMGRKMNEHHASLLANRPPVQRSRRELMAEGNPGVSAVFRPHSYVPDPKKAQGNVDARPVG